MADLYAFKNRSDADECTERNRQQAAQAQLRRDSINARQATNLAIRSYWVVPKGTVSGATNFKTPGVGVAYIVELDRDSSPVVLRRRQWPDQSGVMQDVEVPIYNYSSSDIVEDQNDPDGLKPLLRANEDAFGELSFELQSDFRVILTNVGGTNGDEETQNSFLYDVKLPTGQIILAGTNFSTAHHDYSTYELGEVRPAVSGQAFWDGDQVNVYLTNERLIVEACSDAGGDGVPIEP